jgi:hypothetical protein
VVTVKNCCRESSGQKKRGKLLAKSKPSNSGFNSTKFSHRSPEEESFLPLAKGGEEPSKRYGPREFPHKN